MNCLDNESINVNTGALKILKAYHLKCVFQHNFSFFIFYFEQLYCFPHEYPGLCRQQHDTYKGKTNIARNEKRKKNKVLFLFL